MTVASAHAIDEIRRRSVWVGTIITSAVVAAGAAVAMWTVPAVPTPPNVAQAYVEARFDENWATVWSLMCRPTRSVYGNYTAFAKTAAYLAEHDVKPSEVDISVGDVHGGRGPSGPAAAVTVTVASAERNHEVWARSQLLVVEEAGELRVCHQNR